MAKLPQSVDTIKQLFQEVGITEYEPQLLLQMCDTAYSLTKQIILEAHSLAQYTGKKQMDKSDVEFAVKAFNEKYWKDRPPKSLLSEIAAEKNSQPLLQIRQNYGLRLPNDRFCQLQPNYEHIGRDEQQSTSSSTEIRQRTQQNQQRKQQPVANVHNFNPELVSNLLMGRSDNSSRKRPFPDGEEKPDEEDDYDQN